MHTFWKVGWCYWIYPHKTKQESYSGSPWETSTLSQGVAANIAITATFKSCFQFFAENKSISILKFDALDNVTWFWLGTLSIFCVLKNAHNVVTFSQVLAKCDSNKLNYSQDLKLKFQLFNPNEQWTLKLGSQLGVYGNAID